VIEFSVLTLSQSQAVISKDDDELSDAPADATTTPKNAGASSDGPGSSSRRGLRTRTPAQQRPYFHNAQVFDELVSDEPEAEADSKSSPPKPKQKLRLTGLAQVSFPEVEEEREEQEEVTVLEENDDDEELMLESEEPRAQRKPHYKGKGRAWKKTSDDEDEDYRSPVKVKPSQPTRKFGRRKSTQTAEDLAEEPESEELAKQQQHEEQAHKKVEPVAQSPTPKSGKRPRKPRKISHLSEEFVKDDSDAALEEHRELEAEAEPERTQSITSISPAQKTPKKRGRPRKSDQGSALKPKKEKTTVSKDLTSAGNDPQVLSPPRSAPSSRKKVTMTGPTTFTKTNVGKSAEPEENGRGRPAEFTTPGKNAQVDLVDLTVTSSSKKKTPERSAEVISLSGTDRSDDSEPEVISEKTSTRRTERALASDLQALDDSGKAVTLPGPASSDAADPVVLEAVKLPSPPAESA
jgi:hypothetical protein